MAKAMATSEVRKKVLSTGGTPFSKAAREKLGIRPYSAAAVSAQRIPSPAR